MNQKTFITIAIVLVLLGITGADRLRVEAELDRLKGQLDECLRTASSTHQELAGLATILDSVRDSVEPVHEKCQLLEERVHLMNDDRNALSVSLVSVRSEVSEQERAFAGLRLEFARVQESLGLTQDSVRARLDHLEVALDKSERVQGTAQQHLEELRSGLASLAVQLHQLPAGVIIPWMPGHDSLPSGWLVCDGSQGTPDLRERFLRGVVRPADAGIHVESARMSPAGFHMHATSPDWNRYGLARSTPRQPGDWRVQFDAGGDVSDPDAQTQHGLHTHDDEQVPAHFTVLFIMKADEGGN